MRNITLLLFVTTITTPIFTQHDHYDYDINKDHDLGLRRAALPIAFGAIITGFALYTINNNNNSSRYLYNAGMFNADVAQLQEMKENDIISEKDFSKERKQYASYIGNKIIGESPEEREDIFAAIVALYDLKSDNTLTETEFENKKRRLLKLL
ncbi:uncharacterized protein METZ01_LOCUS119597 [marine metagenome]|uniref:Uncharacterized protein n=1 Tax=marine metagenome TaxID=408172 RepID=A0A381XR76_9ZZZZ